MISEVGQSVEDFKAGDVVVSNGPNANVVNVVKNLCAKIPNNVSDETASFKVGACIGLQGMRLSKPTLGETFVITCAWLIGLSISNKQLVFNYNDSLPFKTKIKISW